MSKSSQERHRMQKMAKVWSAWREVAVTEELRASSPHMAKVDKIWANSRFEVNAFVCSSSIGGITQLVIFRHGHLDTVDFNEAQRIKTELFGPDVVAVEVYPKGVIPALSIRVLWIMPVGHELAYGIDKEMAWGGK